jgi:hypothetical protein
VVGGRCAGASSFDLISVDVAVAAPCRRDEYFVRMPGEAPFRTCDRPSSPLVGFGSWFSEDEARYPSASRFGGLLKTLRPAPPELLQPTYLIEPSISLPKLPFGRVGGG